MSFEAYIENIYVKTGKKPEDFYKLAQVAGVLKPGLKASEFTNWLKKDFGLGHGHAAAMWGLFVSNGWVTPKNSKLKKGQFDPSNKPN